MTSSVLVLGGGEGWHADQLHLAAKDRGIELCFAAYERLHVNVAGVVGQPSKLLVSAGVYQNAASSRRELRDFDAVLTRTMPAGSMETITFRLSVLHEHQSQNGRIINPPRSLELAIDKFATLAEVARLGIPTPDTVVAQSVGDALAAYDALGGDVIVKPLFGGEGRGVMRVQNRELAWTTFRTLFQLESVIYVQKFVPPGGRDWRVLIIGPHTHMLRRINDTGFRTNVAAGASCESVPLDSGMERLAKDAAGALGLTFCSVDFLETVSGDPVLVEVNAIPGWRGAQKVLNDNLADQIIGTVISAG